MTTAIARPRACSNCHQQGLTTPFCPSCGAPTYAPSSASGSQAAQAPSGNGAPPPANSSQPTYAAPSQTVPPQKKGTPTWAKVLIVLTLLFVATIGGCAALIGSVANSVDKELSKPSSGAADPSEVKARASLGQDLTLKGTTYQVSDVSTASSLGDSFSRVKANGTFVIVKLSLTNRKNEPATIIGDNLRIIGANMSSYSTSDDALLAVKDQFLLEEIQPGVTEKGTLVYDLPDSAVSGAKLQVTDLFSDEKGQIDLGL